METRPPTKKITVTFILPLFIFVLGKLVCLPPAGSVFWAVSVLEILFRKSCWVHFSKSPDAWGTSCCGFLGIIEEYGFFD